MEYLLGVRDIASFDADARPGDWAQRLIYYYANVNPFTALMARLNRKRAKDSLFSAFETDLPPLTAVINHGGGYEAGNTDLVVDDGAGTGKARIFRQGMLMRVGSNLSSGEILRVAADPLNDNTIIVQRGYAGTTAGAIADNAVLTIIGDAHPDGGDSPTAVHTTPDKVYNYMQIFQTSWELTRRAGLVDSRYGESEDIRLQRTAYEQHALQREMAFLYGKRAIRTSSVTNSEETTMGGVTEFIVTNTMDGSGGGFTKALWKAFCRPLSDYGSIEKVAFCGGTAFGAIQDMIGYDATQTMTPMENRWGFRIDRLRTDGPDLLLMKHPLLTRVAPGDIIILDLPLLTFRFDVDFKKEVVPIANNTEKTKKQFKSDCGLGMGMEEAHAYVQGVTAFTPPA